MNKKMMTTAFAGLWLIVSCVTHAGIIYEMDCSDIKCSDDIKLSGSFEFEDGITLTTGKWYDEEHLKGYEINYLDVTTSESLRFGSYADEYMFFSFALDSNNEIETLWFNTTFYPSATSLVFIEYSGDSLYAGSWDYDVGMARGPDLEVSFYRTPSIREAVDVPAPHAATILALGILGLATRRFKKQS